MHVSNSQFEVRNSQIINNVADSQGGGIVIRTLSGRSLMHKCILS